MTTLQEMLDDALTRIDSMSAEDFEAECIKAGYSPTRKKNFIMAEETQLEETGQISYRHNSFLDDKEDTDFLIEPANDDQFSIAA
ncbi:MAG: hypothetical protein HLX50_13305 [Alteromonadaceae bacterium]|nr:hypothetical protein [Alteromonadaceae bacterium]